MIYLKPLLSFPITILFFPKKLWSGFLRLARLHKSFLLEEGCYIHPKHYCSIFSCRTILWKQSVCRFIWKTFSPFLLFISITSLCYLQHACLKKKNVRTHLTDQSWCQQIKTYDKKKWIKASFCVNVSLIWSISSKCGSAIKTVVTDQSLQIEE